MMKRSLCLLAALLLLCGCALAEPLPLAPDLAGDACYPLGSTTENAHFVYHYAYPQIAGDDEVAQLINGTYAMVRGEVVDFTAPIQYESLTTELPSRIDATYRITCNSDDYFSVVLTTANHMDGYDYTVMSAQVFSRKGGKAGQVTSLPYLLGILTPGETDTWLQDRQTAKADSCIRSMIWEMMEDEGIPEGVDEEFMAECFYPEEDFYMDEDGTLVFFVQVFGDEPVHLYRLSMEDILDEL